MKKLLKFKLLITVLIIFLLAACTKQDDEIYFKKNSETNITYSKLELEILKLVNDHSSSIDLNRLEKMSIISNVAKSHSNYMAETGSLSHDNFSKRQDELIAIANAKAVGENVGFGYSNAKDTVQEWLNSDSHKKIIEKPKYTHFGISTKQNTKGSNFFTHIFITK